MKRTFFPSPYYQLPRLFKKVNQQVAVSAIERELKTDMLINSNNFNVGL